MTININAHGLLGSDSVEIADVELRETWLDLVDSTRRRASAALDELRAAISKIDGDAGLNERGKRARRREAAETALKELEKLLGGASIKALRATLDEAQRAVPEAPPRPRDLGDQLAAAIWARLERSSAEERLAFIQAAARAGDSGTVWAISAAPPALRSEWLPAPETWKEALTAWRSSAHADQLAHVSDLEGIASTIDWNLKAARRQVAEIGGLPSERELIISAE